MNILLIVGLIILIVVIALAAYFMLAKKEGIKDGNYIIREGDGRNKIYIIVSKDNVEFGNYVDNLPNKKMDFKLIKTGMTFKFDEKELPLFETSNPIDNKTSYFAQSLDDSIFILTKDTTGSLIVAPVKFVPTNRLS